MATVVQDSGKKIADSFGATTSGSFGSLPTVGNDVIVLISHYRYNPPGIATVTDNQGNSYTKDKETTTGTPDHDIAASIWRARVNTSSGTFTITLTPVTDSSNFAAWVAVEVSGLATSPVDQTGSNTGGTTGDANVTADGATSAASGLVVALASLNIGSTNINITTATTGYTAIVKEQDAAQHVGHASDYKTDVSGTVTANWTHDNGSQTDWVAVVVVYADAAGGQPTRKRGELVPHVGGRSFGRVG